jgi:hypothetical protein
MSLPAAVILRNSVQQCEICTDINMAVLSILILDIAENIISILEALNEPVSSVVSLYSESVFLAKLVLTVFFKFLIF